MQQQGIEKESLFLSFWRKAWYEFRQVKSVVGASMLSAAGVVLKQFSFYITPLLRVNFSFLGIAMAAYLYGPFVAGFTGTIVDIFGYLLRPTGPYFFGFTLNAFIEGLIYGCWLYNKPVKIWRCLGACLTASVIINLLLNPIWLHIMYGEAFSFFVGARIIKNAIQLPFNVALLTVILKFLKKYQHKTI